MRGGHVVRSYVVQNVVSPFRLPVDVVEVLSMVLSDRFMALLCSLPIAFPSEVDSAKFPLGPFGPDVFNRAV